MIIHNYGAGGTGYQASWYVVLIIEKEKNELIFAQGNGKGSRRLASIRVTALGLYAARNIVCMVSTFGIRCIVSEI